jgi:hypothetical protein
MPSTLTRPVLDIKRSRRQPACATSCEWLLDRRGSIAGGRRPRQRDDRRYSGLVAAPELLGTVLTMTIVLESTRK